MAVPEPSISHFTWARLQLLHYIYINMSLTDSICMRTSTVYILKCIYLMAVFDGGGDLSEDASSIAFCEPVVVDVVVEFSTVCMLHHQNDLVLVLKHWKYTSGKQYRKTEVW